MELAPPVTSPRAPGSGPAPSRGRARAGLAVQGTLTVLVVLLLGPVTLSLLVVHLPLALVAGGCGAVAVLRPRRLDACRSVGLRALYLLAFATPAGLLAARGDWVHSLWSLQLPLSGLTFGAGWLLVETGEAEVGRGRARRGALVALGVALGIALLPLTLAVLPFEARAADPALPGLPRAFLEVLAYGFGGEVPACMGTVEGGRPGVPPRLLTVTLGAWLLAAVHGCGVALIALTSLWLAGGRRRWGFELLAPMALGLLTLGAFLADGGPNMGRTLYQGIWRNAGWFVAAQGPALALAALLALALLIPIRPRRGAGSG
jgi:hypothetical protein